MTWSHDSEQARHRKDSVERCAARGFAEGELQSLYRNTEVLTRPWDDGEVYDAICDALTREGCTAWPGDGTGCVLHMLKIQHDARLRAEEKLAEIEKVWGMMKELTKRYPASEWNEEYRELASIVHAVGRDFFYVEPR